MKRSPNTLEDLKFVLGTITVIRDMSVSVEMRVGEIQERYRTLSMYNVEVSSPDSVQLSYIVVYKNGLLES